MAGVASAVGLWNKPSKEELERDAVCKAFVKILEYMDREVDKNMDGKVSIEDLTVYIADCGIKLNDENVGEMEKFASEDRMFNKTTIQVQFVIDSIIYIVTNYWKCKPATHVCTNTHSTTPSRVASSRPMWPTAKD